MSVSVSKGSPSPMAGLRKRTAMAETLFKKHEVNQSAGGAPVAHLAEQSMCPMDKRLSP